MGDDLNRRFFYENGTFINKLGSTNKDMLRRVEYDATYRAEVFLYQHPILIKDISSLFSVHRFLFGGLYDWAGELRDYNLQKADTVFASPSRFDESIQYINSLLIKSDNLHDDSEAKRVIYAELMDNINFFHPFREGNGRATRTFLTLLARQQGFLLRYPRENNKLTKALIQSNVKEIGDYLEIHETKDVPGSFENRFLYSLRAEVSSEDYNQTYYD